MKGKEPTVAWFNKKDIDGFFGLGLDNLIQFILISTLCQQVLQMPMDFLVTRIFPGAAVSIIFGNVFYSWQARRLARKTGRTDVTALPYGINTVSLIAFILFVMHPVYQETGNMELAWKVGVLACFLSGLIELLGAFVAERIRKVTPRAALLSALAGIAMTFISMDFLFKIFEKPGIAMFPMVIILAQYFARIRYPFGIPGGLLALLVGTVLYWSVFPDPHAAPLPCLGSLTNLTLPQPAVGGLWEVLQSQQVYRHLSVIVPMGLLNVVGSLQNIESAEAGGDAYSTPVSLSVNGIGSILAALLGSCFPTTIYIGHPGWKAMGARSGYSLMNALFIGLLCFSGTVLWVVRIVPLEAGIGILLWIGIIMCAQAFQATPKEHAPAVAFGLFPSLAAWGAMMLEQGLRQGGSSLYHLMTDAPDGVLTGLQGILSLNQGFLFTGMIFSAVAVYLIDRDFLRAALWALVAAGCAFIGLIHAYRVTPGGIVPTIGWGTAQVYAWNYLLIALFFTALNGWQRVQSKRGSHL
jgi:adenine/guanine/hypoxanthine permease